CPRATAARRNTIADAGPRRALAVCRSPAVAPSTLAQQPQAQRELHILGAMRQADFLMNALLVGVHRLGADPQLLADFGRGVALGRIAEDLALTLGESLEAVAIRLQRVLPCQAAREQRCRRGPHVHLAPRDRAHR